MKRRVIISATLTEALQVQQLSALPPGVSLVEVRADAFAADRVAIKKNTSASLLFSLKSKSEGGEFTGLMKERIPLLISASPYYDFIELEGERDLIPEILEAIPAEKRIITWQGLAESDKALRERLHKYSKIPATYYRLVIEAKKSGDELSVLRILNSNQKNVIAYAIGPIGMWTQPLSAFLGSPLVPSSLNAGAGNMYFSPGQLMEDYNLPFTYPVEKVFGIVGNPVFTSLSPRLHNEAYRNLNLPYLYLPFQADTLQEFFKEVVNEKVLPINFSGFTVVSPFKEEGLKISGASCDPDVFVSEASNILVNQHEIGWTALSTDALGLMDALDKRAPGWEQKNIALVGCGGTGRTIAAALKRINVRLTLVNRTTTKGLKIAQALELPFIPLDRFNPASFDILIHATPLGGRPGEMPFDVSKLKRDCVVIDHVYSLLEETELVKYCRLCNISIIDGQEIARLQIRHQFKKMTNLPMPGRSESNTLNPLILNPK